MSNLIQQSINKWLHGSFDEDVKKQIVEMQRNNPEDVADAFYKNLEFGTGGLRGIMGVGTNRMNKYTVGMATQGYANYLKHSFPNEEVRVAIAYDSRNNSHFFCRNCCTRFCCQRYQGIFIRRVKAHTRFIFHHPPSKMPGRSGVHCFT